MALPRLNVLNTADRVLAQIQDNVQKVLSAIAHACPLLDGTLLVNVVVGTTDTMVGHALNRVPLGYLVVGRSGAGEVFTSSSANPVPKSLLVLKASAPVTVSLWVF